METWNALVAKIVDALKRLGGAALVGMMLLTCVDVTLRFINYPLFGAVEMVSFMATVLLACAMPITHLEHGHVGVDLMVRKFKPRTQAAVDAITGLLSAGTLGVVSWQSFIYAMDMKSSGEVSMSTGMPNYIIVYVVAVAFGVLFLVIMGELLDNLRKVMHS